MQATIFEQWYFWLKCAWPCDQMVWTKIYPNPQTFCPIVYNIKKNHLQWIKLCPQIAQQRKSSWKNRPKWQNFATSGNTALWPYFSDPGISTTLCPSKNWREAAFESVSTSPTFPTSSGKDRLSTRRPDNGRPRSTWSRWSCPCCRG